MSAAKIGDGRDLLVDNVLVDIEKYNGDPIALEFPASRRADGDHDPDPRVPWRRGEQQHSPRVATLKSEFEVRVPLFMKESEKVKVHTETRKVTGRS